MKSHVEVSYLKNVFMLKSQGAEGDEFCSRIPSARKGKSRRVWLVDEVYWWDLYLACKAHLGGIPECVYSWFTRAHPDPVPDFPSSLPGGELREYQTYSAGVLAANDRAVCADEMGLGKTVSALAAWHYLQEQGDVGPLLLIGPGSVLSQWASEYKKFLVRDDVSVIETRDDLRKPLPSSGMIAIGYPKLFRDGYKEYLRSLLIREPNTTICLDEAHRIGSASSKRGQEIAALGYGARKVWALTGTEIRNQIDSYLPLYRLITGSRITEAGFAAYYKRGTDWNRDKLKLLKPVRSQYTIRRVTEDVLGDLPPMTQTVVECEFSPQQQRYYRDMVDDKLERELEEGGFESLSSEGIAKVIRGLQVCSHPLLLGGLPSRNFKYAALQGIIDNLGEKRAIIWSYFPDVIRWLQTQVEEDGYTCEIVHGGVDMGKRETIRSRFWNNEFQILIANPSAYGEGVNLQCASHAVYWDESYSKIKWEQSLKRIHRIGQTLPVYVYYLRHANSREMDAHHAIRRKQALAEEVTIKREDVK